MEAAGHASTADGAQPEGAASDFERSADWEPLSQPGLFEQRPELVLAGAALGGFLLAQVVRRLRG